MALPFVDKDFLFRRNNQHFGSRHRHNMGWNNNLRLGCHYINLLNMSLNDENNVAGKIPNPCFHETRSRSPNSMLSGVALRLIPFIQFQKCFIVWLFVFSI